MVSRNALQSANGNRLFVKPGSSACWLAWTVTGSTENSRKNVGMTVDEVSVIDPSLGDKPNIFGHVGVSRTSPLAIHDFMEVVGILDIRPLHGRLWS